MTEKARFLAKGAAHVAVVSGAVPLSVSFVLLPKFTLLAFSAAIEPLRMANQLTGQVFFEWQTLSPRAMARPRISRKGSGRNMGCRPIGFRISADQRVEAADPPERPSPRLFLSRLWRKRQPARRCAPRGDIFGRMNGARLRVLGGGGKGGQARSSPCPSF